MKDENKFPWRTMLIWDSWPEELGTWGWRLVNLSGHPECDKDALRTTIFDLSRKAIKKSPLQGKQHIFAAILTLYSEKEGDVEIIDYAKHEPAKVKTIKEKSGIQTHHVTQSSDALSFIRRICNTFPDLCGDIIKDIDMT